MEHSSISIVFKCKFTFSFLFFSFFLSLLFSFLLFPPYLLFLHVIQHFFLLWRIEDELSCFIYILYICFEFLLHQFLQYFSQQPRHNTICTMYCFFACLIISSLRLTTMYKPFVSNGSKGSPVGFNVTGSIYRFNKTQYSPKTCFTFKFSSKEFSFPSFPNLMKATIIL